MALAKVQDGLIVGALAATGLITLEDRLYYRADFWESAPALCGKGILAALLAVAAIRALELKAEGLVFGSLPALEATYRRLGFSDQVPSGWKLDPALVAFLGSVSLLSKIEEETNGWNCSKKAD
jgi:hypothetical protein